MAIAICPAPGVAAEGAWPYVYASTAPGTNFR